MSPFFFFLSAIVFVFRLGGESCWFLRKPGFLIVHQGIRFRKASNSAFYQFAALRVRASVEARRFKSFFRASGSGGERKCGVCIKITYVQMRG